MNDTIRLSDAVSLSGSLGGETLAILGMKGKGKSNTAKVVVEQLLGAGVQTVILDPTDAWWGLPFARDGSPSGLPVVTFGGHPDRTMLPLEERHADAIVAMILERGLSPILCTRGMSGAAQTRFVTRLLTGLYDGKGERRDKRPLAVAIDEADMFAPKGGVSGGAAACKGAVDDISRRGRVDGFALIAVTQRPAALHNDVLSQADTVVCHALALQHDRKAVEEWTAQHDDDPEKARVFRQSLSGLPAGEAWVWSPGRGVFERTRIDLCSTMDSGKTPTGAEPAPIGRGGTGGTGGGAIDLEELRRVLEPPPPEKPKKAAGSGEQGAAKKEREEIAALRSELAETRRARDEAYALCDQMAAAISAAKEALDGSDRNTGLDAGIGRTRPAGVDSPDAPLSRTVSGAGRDPVRDDAAAEDGGSAPDRLRRRDHPSTRVGAAGGPHRPSNRPNDAGDDRAVLDDQRRGRAPHPDRRAGRVLADARAHGGSPGVAKILTALAWWETLGVAAPTRVQAALVAGRAPNTGSLNSLLSQMSSDGLIEYPEPGRLSLTEGGRRLAERPDEPDDPEALRAAVLAVLKGPEAAVYDALWEAHLRGRDEMTRDGLAQRLDRAPNTGSFNSLLSKLNGMGVVVYPRPGVVALAPEVGPGVFA